MRLAGRVTRTSPITRSSLPSPWRASPSTCRSLWRDSSHDVVDETELKGPFDFQLDWMNIGSTPNADGVTAKLPTFPSEFEVAEVRPAKPFTPPAGRGGVTPALGPEGWVTIQNGRVEFQSATLKGLITFALDLDPRMLVGGPKWLDEDRFDVIAKTTANVPWEAMQAMLKKLIVERFQLKTHTEDHPVQVYVLEAGKKPNLKPSDGTARSECKVVQADQRYYVCQNTTMAQFAERLGGYATGYVHPPLLDLTGIPGAFDIKLYWTPRQALQNAGGRGGDPSGQASTRWPSSPSTRPSTSSSG